MNIREVIMDVLMEREVGAVDAVGVEYSLNEDVDEIPTGDLLLHAIPFIRGVRSDRAGDREEALDLFREFCADCEYLGLVDREVVRVCGMHGRENRIWMAYRLGRFRFDCADWDSREWVLELLEHLYIRSMRGIEHLQREMELAGMSREDDGERKGIECVRIDEGGRRENMLVSRIVPTMSLEEFADKVMGEVQETEAAGEEESEDCSREELMRRDKRSDERSVQRGNTTGMG